MPRMMLLLPLVACQPTNGPGADAATSSVWVLRHDVDLGDTLDEADMVQAAVAWLAPGEPPTLEQLVGATPRARMDAGQPIRTERMAEPGSGRGLLAILPPQMRAITVPVRTAAGLRSGVYVDVFVADQLVLRNVTVLGVYAAEGEAPAVTLYILPRFARALLSDDPIHLVVRNPVHATHITEHGKLVLDGPDAEIGVAVARRDLYPGVEIAPGDLIRLPAPGWTDTLAPELVVGRVVIDRLLAGEPVREAWLADPVHGRGLEALVPEGNLLVYAPIAGMGHQGMVPGAYVDLLGFGPDGPEEVAQGLFVGAWLPVEGDQPAHLGLIGDPSATGAVAVAVNRRDLALVPVLRGLGDTERADYGLDTGD